MPHEKARKNLLSDSCNFSLDRRRALTLSPGIKRDCCQMESVLKIPRRVSTAEDECVDTEMSKDQKKGNSKIKWTQLLPNGTSSQSNPKSQKNSEHAVWQEIHRRQVKVVLEDVLQTEIGQSFLRCSDQKTNQSESKRRSGHTSTAAFKDKRTSLAKRAERDTTEPKATSPSNNQTVSSTKNESCSHKETKNLQSKQQNSSLKISEPQEVSSNSCLPRERDSPKRTKSSTFKDNEVSLLEGSPEQEALSSGCESVCSPSSPLASQSSQREEKSSEELLPNKKERREAQVCPKNAAENKENHLLINGEVVQEVEGMRGSVLRLSAGADGQIPVKRCRMDSLSDEQAPNSDPASGSVEGRSFILETSKVNTSELIVLSSEEEEEGDESEERETCAINIHPPEGAQDMNVAEKSAGDYEQKKESHLHTTEMDEQSSAVIRLQLSSFHMGGVNATSGDSMTMTADKITFTLQDSSVKISLSTSSVCKYSVWEGFALRWFGLVQDDEAPSSSLLLFWLSDAQAHQLHDKLFEELGIRPAEGSTCLLLCLAHCVTSIDCALLASLMDVVSLNQSTPELSSPLSQSESLELLQRSQETNLLQLLAPNTDAQTSTAPHAAASTSQDSDVQLKPVNTLCHRRTRGSYSVSLAPTPGAEWTPYRHCGPAHRLIQFPPPPSKRAITVTTEDLECLDSGEFLNDVIIDFYLKYLMAQKAPKASVERSHIFSSFFYKQLTRRDNANEDSTSTPAQVRRHQRVRTWTRHVDIFKKDFLFVPVNQEAHWYLVVICFPGLEEKQYVKREDRGSVQDDGGEGSGESDGDLYGENRFNSDEDKNTDDSRIKSSTSPLNCTESTCKRQTFCRRPCILIMDSLKLSVHERIFKLLREYLQVEWAAKRGSCRDFNVDHIVGSHCKVPLQDNSSDCGLYLLQYAESFLQDPIVHFDLPLRLESWFPRQQVRGKREEIRDLILYLYRFQQGSLGNEALEDRTDYGNAI